MAKDAREDPDSILEDRERKDELAQKMATDSFERLLEGIHDACYDWIVEGRAPELDEGRTHSRAHGPAADLVTIFRKLFARRGLTLAEAGRLLLGWTKARAEQVSSDPSELLHEEALRLALELGIPMARLFELMESEGVPPADR